MKKVIKKQDKRERRQRRVRAKVFGTASCPRLNVFRSLKGIYAQLIDDEKGRTIVGVYSKNVKPEKTDKYKGKMVMAYAVGKELGSKAKTAGVSKVVFDRAGYLYHGRVEALADGARDGGLKF